jgi:hypothetical protein
MPILFLAVPLVGIKAYFYLIKLTAAFSRVPEKFECVSNVAPGFFHPKKAI